MLDEYDDILTSKETMQILKISKKLLYALIREKRLPAYKLGKKDWRFNKDDLITYLHNQNK